MSEQHQDDNPISVRIIHGDPMFSAAAELRQRMLAEAGLDPDSAPSLSHRPMRTTFHIAQLPDGTVVGAMNAVLGELEELAINPLIDPDTSLPGPICECGSISVVEEMAGLGVPELLYRSVYCFARRQGAASLAAVMEPLNAEMLREAYGVPFRNLGPLQRYLGVEMCPVGGTLDELEEGVRVAQPGFYEFLTEPLQDGPVLHIV